MTKYFWNLNILNPERSYRGSGGYRCSGKTLHFFVSLNIARIVIQSMANIYIWYWWYSDFIFKIDNGHHHDDPSTHLVCVFEMIIMMTTPTWWWGWAVPWGPHPFSNSSLQGDAWCGSPQNIRWCRTPGSRSAVLRIGRCLLLSIWWCRCNPEERISNQKLQF